MTTDAPKAPAFTWDLYKDLNPEETNTGARRSDGQGFVCSTMPRPWEPGDKGRLIASAKVRGIWNAWQSTQRTFPIDQLEAAKAWVDVQVKEDQEAWARIEASLKDG